MRVGIDAHMLGDHSGGNESYYFNILNNMVPQDDMEIIVFVKPGIDASFLENKFRVVRFKNVGPFRRNFIELSRLCKEYGLDVLHTQYFIPFYRPCPVVCSIHDLCFEHCRNIFTTYEYVRQKLLIPYAARRSKCIYASSRYSKQDIAKCYGIPKNRIMITYDAVDKRFRKLNDTELDEQELRHKFGIGNSEYVLSVGNLQPRKNLPRLIKAFLSYKRKNPNGSKLVIVGKKAWMYEEIMGAARENTKDIVFTDYVSTADLIRLYNAAGCFVYPSFFEGFGIPPLEAMACGTPVAVSKETSLPEVVGQAGIYFDPFSEQEIENAIRTLMKMGPDREQYVYKGYEQVKRFSWKKTADVVMEGYRRCV